MSTFVPTQVVIAGAGVAGLETLLALHALAGPRVTTTVLSPDRTFAVRAASVGTPFGHGSPPQHDLGAIVAAHGAYLVSGTLDIVDRDERCAVTRDGERLMYDALVVAVGAQSEPAFAAASTFTGAPDSRVMSDALLELEAGRARSIAFVVPPGVTWALPLYELALMTAAHIELHGIEADVSVVTPEPAPLALLGEEASQYVVGALREADVAILSATEVTEVDLAGRLLSRSGTILQAEQVIALPRLRAPSIGGLPRADDGFIPVDVHGHVPGRDARLRHRRRSCGAPQAGRHRRSAGRGRRAGDRAASRGPGEHADAASSAPRTAARGRHDHVPPDAAHRTRHGSHLGRVS